MWFLRASAIALTLFAAPAFAIQPGRWVHTTEADFSPGKTERVVVTNLGDVKLAARTEKIGDLAEQTAIVNDLQPIGNDLYIAAGPDAGKLLRRRGDKIEEVANLTGEQIFSLDADAQGRLLVGISGPRSRLARLEGGKLKTLIVLPDVRYIWDMLVDGQRVVLATGAEGRLLLVDLVKAAQVPVDEAAATNPATQAGTQPAPVIRAEPQPRTAPTTMPATRPSAATRPGTQPATRPAHPAITELLDAAQANVLCLGRDKQGPLYAGTDTDGLVYRVTLKPDGEAETFVVYDAPEPEVGALLVMADGTIYAGTADAEQAKPGRLSEASAVEAGRPQLPAAPPPQPPNPGDLPQVPPQPKPIKAAPSGTGAAAPVGSSGTSPVGAVGASDNGAANESVSPDRDEITDEPEDQMEEEPVIGEAPSIEGPDGESADPVRRRLAAWQAGAPEVPGVPGVPAAPGPDAPAGAAEPTPQQRDQLRDVIRQRLEQARETGVMQTPPRIQRRPASARGPTPPRTGPRPPGGPGTREGNAVYRITAEGFVNEVFRESTMILKIIDDGGTLLVGTGNEGQIFRIDPAAGETTILADLDPQQVPAMVRLPDGAVLLGTANPATIIRLDRGFAADGAYTSAALDAAQISLWGALQMIAAIPEGAAVEVQTRSGNVQDPDQAAWSDWSKPQTLAGDAKADPLAPRELKVASPPARFVQYRLTLKGKDGTTPVVDRVSLAYVVPNLKPVVAAIRGNYPGGGGPGGSGGGSSGPSRGPRPPSMSSGPGASGGGGGAGDEAEPQTTMNIEWEASDPNNDRLRYVLEYQPAGTRQWLPLAKDLDAPNHEWQTRRVPDGRYVLRVTASDAPDNTTDMAQTAVRQSDPIVVDNGRPDLRNLKQRVEEKVVVLTAEAFDALSPIRAVHYAVDSTDKWQPVLPDDLIYDSTAEAFTVKIPGLSAGPHAITLRVLDARGNSRYESVFIEVK